MRNNDNYLYREGTTPNTRVAVSQKNKVYSISKNQSNFSQIGVMSSFSYDDSRSIEPTRGVGYGDQVAELVPGVTEPISLDIERQLLYLANMHQVLGYAGGTDGLVRSLKHHRWPFDIKKEMAFSELATQKSGSGGSGSSNTVQASDGENQALLTFFEACWLESYSVDGIEADGAQLSESVSAICSDIVDGQSTYNSNLLETGNNPFSSQTGGSTRFDGNVAGPSGVTV